MWNGTSKSQTLVAASVFNETNFFGLKARPSTASLIDRVCINVVFLTSNQARLSSF